MALVLYQNLSAGPAVPTGAGTVTLPMRPAPGHADEMESSAATSPACAKVGSTLSSTRALGSSSYCWSDQNGGLVGARATCSNPGSNRLAFAVHAGSETNVRSSNTKSRTFSSVQVCVNWVSTKPNESGCTVPCAQRGTQMFVLPAWLVPGR